MCFCCLFSVLCVLFVWNSIDSHQWANPVTTLLSCLNLTAVIVTSVYWSRANFFQRKKIVAAKTENLRIGTCHKFNVPRRITEVKARYSPRGVGDKMLTLGKQHYFVWDTASQSTKWLDMLKILGGTFMYCCPIISRSRSRPKTLAAMHQVGSSWCLILHEVVKLQ